MGGIVTVEGETCKAQQVVAENFQRAAEEFERGRRMRRERRAYEHHERMIRAERPVQRYELDRVRRGGWRYIQGLERRITKLEARLS